MDEQLKISWNGGKPSTVMPTTADFAKTAEHADIHVTVDMHDPDHDGAMATLEAAALTRPGCTGDFGTCKVCGKTSHQVTPPVVPF